MNSKKGPRGKSMKPPVSIKLLVLFSTFAIFLSVIQFYPSKEWYPFSRMDMYARKINALDFKVTSISMVLKNGQVLPFPYTRTLFYLSELRDFSQSDEPQSDQIKNLLFELNTEIKDLQTKGQLKNVSRVDIIFKQWNEFELSRLNQPDLEKTVHSLKIGNSSL